MSEQTATAGKASPVAQIVRLGSSVGAQTVASVGSLMLAVMIARALPQSGLGVFSLLTATQVVAMGIIRAMSTELVVFRDRIATEGFADDLLSSCSGASLILSTSAGSVVAASGLVFSDYSIELIIAGAILPATILQDHTRYLLIFQRRSIAALGVDVVFCVVQGVGLAVVAGSPDLADYLLPWLAASGCAGLLGLRVSRVWPGVRGGLRWIRDTRRRGRVYLGDFLTTSGVSQGAVYLVAILGGTAATGALRGAQILLSPLQMIVRGGFVALASEASLLASKKKFRLLAWVGIGYACAGASGACLVVVVMLLIPESVSVALLGDSSDAALAVLPYAGSATAALSIAMGAGLVLRSVGLVEKVLKVKVLAAPFSLAFVALGTWWGGAPGSQIGLAIGESGRAMGSWREFGRWKSGQTTKGVTPRKDRSQ